jgi:hypothetical protein
LPLDYFACMSSLCGVFSGLIYDVLRHTSIEVLSDVVSICGTYCKYMHAGRTRARDNRTECSYFPIKHARISQSFFRTTTNPRWAYVYIRIPVCSSRARGALYCRSTRKLMRVSCSAGRGHARTAIHTACIQQTHARAWD